MKSRIVAYGYCQQVGSHAWAVGGWIFDPPAEPEESGIAGYEWSELADLGYRHLHRDVVFWIHGSLTCLTADNVCVAACWPWNLDALRILIHKKEA
jgi:hypothetical protein